MNRAKAPWHSPYVSRGWDPVYRDSRACMPGRYDIGAIQDTQIETLSCSLVSQVLGSHLATSVHHAQSGSSSDLSSLPPTRACCSVLVNPYKYNERSGELGRNLPRLG